MEFTQIVHEIGLEQEAVITVSSLYDRLKNNPAFKRWTEALAEPVSFLTLQEEIAAFSAENGLCERTVRLVLLCATTGYVEEGYRRMGVKDDIFRAFLRDILCKTRECKTVYGVWGIDSFIWYQGFYQISRFSLGRLQFEELRFDLESYSDGTTTVSKGDILINVHIPSDGKLDMEQVRASFDKACRFFDKTYDGKMFFICTSWLLYPPYLQVFQPGSNLRRFVELFDVFAVKKLESFSDGWRVFGTNDMSDIAALPADTSLRRRFKEYMRTTPDFGKGCGMIVMPVRAAR